MDKFLKSGLIFLSCLPCGVMAEGINSIVESFMGSDIRFNRTLSNVPFVPLAYISSNTYQENQLETVNEQDAFQTYQQTNISQFASLPWLLDSHNALMVGEYISYNSFETQNSALESFDVYSAGIPLGWFQQVNTDWQVGAFMFPLWHEASFENASSSFELMGGAFARYYESDQLWWVFGFYADQAVDGDLYLPYVGASWALNKHWTLNAVMPWPAVLYAPNKNVLYRFGVSPSDALWSLNQDKTEIAMSLGGWDFGFSAEYRIQGNYWLQMQVGVAGFKALTISGGEFDGAELGADSSGFFGVSVNYRPSI